MRAAGTDGSAFSWCQRTKFTAPTKVLKKIPLQPTGSEVYQWIDARHCLREYLGYSTMVSTFCNFTMVYRFFAPTFCCYNLKTLEVWLSQKLLRLPPGTPMSVAQIFFHLPGSEAGWGDAVMLVIWFCRWLVVAVGWYPKAKGGLQGRLGIFPCNPGLQFTENHQQKSPRNLLTDGWIDGKTSNDQFCIQKPQFRRRSNRKPQVLINFFTFSLLYPFIYIQVSFLRDPVKSKSMRPCEEAMLSNTFYMSLFKLILISIYVYIHGSLVELYHRMPGTSKYNQIHILLQTTLQRSEASSS